MKKIWIATFITTILGISSAYAAAQDAGGGTVQFIGNVTDVSCTVSVDGKGSEGIVTLSPVTVTEMKEAADHTMVKSKKFNIEVTNCTAVGVENLVENIQVSWTGGNLLTTSGGETAGYLAHSEMEGAKNVHFALSTQEDIEGKIIPGSADQKLADNVGSTDPNGIARFEYFVGYVSDNVAEVTAGSVKSYATYEVTYE